MIEPRDLTHTTLPRTFPLRLLSSTPPPFCFFSFISLRVYLHFFAMLRVASLAPRRAAAAVGALPRRMLSFDMSDDQKALHEMSQKFAEQVRAPRQRGATSMTAAASFLSLSGSSHLSTFALEGHFFLLFLLLFPSPSCLLSVFLCSSLTSSSLLKLS